MKGYINTHKGVYYIFLEVLKKKVLPLRQAKLERAINGCLVHFCWGKESTREESTRVHG